MRNLSVFLFEWKHFIRNPFKIIAIILFVIAAVYGLHNGAELYKDQSAEIERIHERINESRTKILADYYDQGIMSPEDRPWVDYSTPFWAIWFSSIYHFKKPSSAMVYSIGQSEQYGFYKRITFWASPYDADMAEEIANPERLQTGTLDFSFTILFILPLLLLVLLYNLKSTENEQGFLPLIQVQYHTVDGWLLSRVFFYLVLIYAVIVGLLFYGAALTPVFESAGDALLQMMLYTMLYLLFWSVLFYAILTKSKSILGSTLFKSAVYLLFTFVVPAAVHQVLSIRHPANLMTDLIDVRDKEQELYRQPDSVFQAKLEELFPEITESPVYRDSLKKNLAMNESGSALSNELNKESIRPIEAEKSQRNTFIEGTFWFNPVSFFQNRFNSISETHYTDYQNYRDEIQTLIDEQIRTLVLDTWNEKRVDKQEYLRYTKELSHDT